MNTIKINGTEYKVKYSIRAMFIFEQIKGEPFGLYTTLDNFVFFYSMIMASNKNCSLKWDDFIDAIDNDNSIVTQLQEVLSNNNEHLFKTDDEGTDEKKS